MYESWCQILTTCKVNMIFSFYGLFRVDFWQLAVTLPQKLRDMRRILTILCAVALLSSCGTARNSQATAGNSGLLHPDEVFTVSQDDIAHETLQINNAISGQWTYSAPSVDVSGKNLLAGMGKPIAKGKLKKKLKNAFKKIGLDKARPQFTFNDDGTCAIKLMGVSMKGSYNYNPSDEKITLKWRGIPMTARLKRDGKKKLHLTFDADKFLSLLSLASKVSDNSALKALSFLLDNYQDVMVGFEMKK